jgi:molybdate transport system regulatory protein
MVEGRGDGPPEADEPGRWSDDAVAPAFDAHLQSEGVVFDAEDATLLRAIDRHGSLDGAASALGRSYSRAHKRLDALQDAFGPLVEAHRGGSDGGGSSLTGGARRLLARFARLRTEFSGVVAVEETVLPGRVRERDGAFAVVETPAGPMRALAPPDAEAVAVTVRADTVTLQDPDAGPDAGATSARNRFSGTVEGVEEHQGLARVAVDVGADQLLLALLTVGSRRRLGLAPGDPVRVSFKATATRATPRIEPAE